MASLKRSITDIMNDTMLPKKSKTIYEKARQDLKILCLHYTLFNMLFNMLFWHVNSIVFANEFSVRQVNINASPPNISPHAVNVACYMYHAQIQQLLRAGKKVVPREKKWTLFHGYSFFSRS